MSAEDARRGGCLDGFVATITGGRFGVETYIAIDKKVFPKVSSRKAFIVIDTDLKDKPNLRIRRRIVRVTNAKGTR